MFLITVDAGKHQAAAERHAGDRLNRPGPLPVEADRLSILLLPEPALMLHP
jgi:hypothetical protein